MSDCCQGAAAGQRKQTLKIVLTVNAVMFVAVLVAGILAHSTALIADSADNLGDALVYALSLYVAAGTLRARASAALVKGLIQLGFGIAVVAGIVLAISGDPRPIGPAIMMMATVALGANLACFALLMKHRNEDINMRSVWLCSRNDVISNIGVIVAGLLVTLTSSPWPDIAVAAIIAAVFLHTSYQVIHDSMAQLRAVEGA